jgi:hypothetical protein
MITTRLTAAFLAIAISLTGCGRPKPDHEFQPITLKAAETGGNVNYSGLDAVLKVAIGPGGEIRPGELKDNEKMLEGQLMLMTVTGPKTKPDLFKDERSKLNYWYNARAAWSLRLILTFSRELLEADKEEVSESQRWEIADNKTPVKDFNNRPFPIDGRSMTLALMDSLIIDQFGFKAVVGAPGMSPLRAVIPTKSFDADDTAKLIDERFNKFIDNESRFAIDVKSQQILVPPVLWRFKDRIIADHQEKYQTTGANLTTALLPHVRLSPHRRLQDAIGYKCTKAPEPKTPLIVKRQED